MVRKNISRVVKLPSFNEILYHANGEGEEETLLLFNILNPK